MSTKIHNIRVALGDDLEVCLRKQLPPFGSFRVLKKSIDARHGKPSFIYSVECFKEGETPPKNAPYPKIKLQNDVNPIVIGAGPAGLFAALRLSESGIHCTILEQGSETVQRLKGITQHWRYGKLDPRNNVCYGEGGAGLFSDGKLMTRIRSPLTPYVLRKLIECGAPPEIEFEANPHVGSNKLRQVIVNLRKLLIQQGSSIRFQTRVQDIEIQSDSVRAVILEDGTRVATKCVVLAPGHSAIALHHTLYKKGVALQPQSFAIGLRIEHPQSLINKIQFGRYADDERLGAAQYALADYNQQLQNGVYSFCMCPGGYVISSSTEPTGVVSNGMSNFARNSPFANAAIVVGLNYAEEFGNDLFAGLQFREDLEKRAFQMVYFSGGAREIPAQRALDFLEGRGGPTIASSTPSGVRAARLDTLFPTHIYKRLSASLLKFDSKMRGFISEGAQLHGVESRTSCPIRIVRDDTSLQSVSTAGLFPAGEGAGYAGGITSAAVDGVRIAEAVIQANSLT